MGAVHAKGLQVVTKFLVTDEPLTIFTFLVVRVTTFTFHINMTTFGFFFGQASNTFHMWRVFASKLSLFFFHFWLITTLLVPINKTVDAHSSIAMVALTSPIHSHYSNYITKRDLSYQNFSNHNCSNNTNS